MYRLLCFCAYLALCQGYAVPVGPAFHTVAAPISVPYVNYGYGLGRYGFGHGLGHGFVTKPLRHHILKRSSHYGEPFSYGGHLEATPIGAHLNALAPLAVSHQERLDVHSVRRIVAPILTTVKEIVTPIVEAAPILHNAFRQYGSGVYGPFHPFPVGHY